MKNSSTTSTITPTHHTFFPFDEEDELIKLIKEKRAADATPKSSSELHVEEITSMDLPTDFENVFALDERAAGVHAQDADTGLILSLSNLGRVDIEYISAITGMEYKDVIRALKGSIYQNPLTWNECFYKGWETADEYLSGNMSRKWRAATEANKRYNGYFSENIKAIEAVLPHPVGASEIHVTLGSPWVPTTVIDDFIIHLLGKKNFHISESALAVRHDENSGIWEIPSKNRYDATRSWSLNKFTYGTPRLSALEIIEKTLNQKTIAIYDTVPSPINKKSKVKVLNQNETLLAVKKQELIIDEFKKWVWTSDVRTALLLEKYDELYSCNRVRHFDGSFLTFPGLNPNLSLYKYQRDAVARILLTPNTLLAHDVGSGKTLIMIAAGMELKRMGISKKNLYVVPNNLVSQWNEMFAHMYSNANVLCVNPKDFTPTKRLSTLKKMRDNDYDAIIIAYSCFDRIAISYDEQARQIEEKIEEYRQASKKLSSDKFAKKREALQKKLIEVHTAKRLGNEIYFDELKVNTIFLDEAHNYKNVPIETQIGNVLGINSTGSARCQGMIDKVAFVQRTNGGRGAVLATGTPITNSITDAFIMQKYLQDGDLKMLGLSSFDGWVGMFAERRTEFEIDVDTGSYRLATRFSKFHNLPELTALLASIADFHVADKSAGIPDFYGYTDSVTEKCPFFKRYLSSISKRADLVRKGKVKRSEDNLLLITTDGRKAALDMRLVETQPKYYRGGKVSKCAMNVYHMYRGYPGTAQLVFCDYSTPKAGFNMYDELKTILIEKGVPASEIEFVHNATSERAREKLFSDVRSGKIRVLIGSTFKLGLGVNVQDKLKAIHHLDVPWRPADMTQREGRILRQGNTNEDVEIFRYITEGSFDAYSWQLLETKQRFISSLLAGHISERSGSDVADTALSYAEIKAIAVGNPKVKERVEVANELDKLGILRREQIKKNEAMAQELNVLPAKIEHQEGLLRLARLDSKLIAPLIGEQSSEQRRELREIIDSALRANVYQPEESDIITYRGMRIVAPANMTEESPYVWLIGNGRYPLELSSSEFGNLIRIDNFLNGFDKHVTKLESGLDFLEGRKEYIENALSEPDTLSDKIEQLQNKLNRIDKELGVINDEK